jgi:hypothetical protein
LLTRFGPPTGGKAADVTLQKDRLRENEELFRKANQRLHEQIADGAPADRLVPFLCECGDDLCMARMEMTLDDYRRLRADGEAFGVLPGHVAEHGEFVVRTIGSYQVVRKEAP